MACLQAADILLPRDGADFEKWAVIACDQFTSQPEYWRRAEAYVGDAPSALRMIYPEAYLGSDGEAAYLARLARIRAEMERYLAEGILAEGVRQGYVLTARETETGTRVGLLAALDLESYDYTGTADKPVRATEETVRERLPVRVGIRQNALLESPHVMMLLDDAACLTLEPLYRKKEEFRKLYDTKLMFGGGRVSGYAIEGERAVALTEQLARLERESGEIFLAAGDGNHSLAAAKTCWEECKKSLSRRELEGHPARYALVEVVNLHSPALRFEAIHRVLYGGKLAEVAEGLSRYLESHGGFRVEETKGDGAKGDEARGDEEADILLLQGTQRLCLRLPDTGGRLAVELLQHFLDEYLKGHPDCLLDYVHSKETVEELAEKKGACGMLLRPIDKTTLFPAICAGGILPRKTFSIGSEIQKRYYMECRRL